jgi:DNA-binding transcriptional MerR regulator
VRAGRAPVEVDAAHVDPRRTCWFCAETRTGPRRRWERAGLLRPGRDRATGYRVYTPGDVRDAQIIGQLRRGGYLLAQIAPLLAELRDATSPASAAAAIADRRARLHARARAMLRASAEVGHYLQARDAARNSSLI